MTGRRAPGRGGRAQRAGAGMVRLGSPGVGDDAGRPDRGGRAGAARRRVGRASSLEVAARFQALVVGPGLGTGAATAGRRPRHARRRRPARAWSTATASPPSARDAASVLGDRAAPTVLTPHDGEYERSPGAPPGADRLDAARAPGGARPAPSCSSRGRPPSWPRRTGACAIVTSGDARLATAGTGDVLSGIIGALLARGLSAARGRRRRRLAPRPSAARSGPRDRAGRRPTWSTGCPTVLAEVVRLMAARLGGRLPRRGRGQRGHAARGLRRRPRCARW